MTTQNSLLDDSSSKKNREKLAALKHDMIMPISAIHGYARLLKDNLDPDIVGLPEEYKEWIERIIKSAKQLQKILDATTID